MKTFTKGEPSLRRGSNRVYPEHIRTALPILHPERHKTTESTGRWRSAV